MPIRHNQTARYRLSILLKGTIDASLAANLPASPTGGDTYQVTVAGDFGSSALINPAGAYFDVTNYVAYNAETSKWDKIDTTENISDAAYDASTWDGDARNAPSKNAIRDKIVLMDAIASGEQVEIDAIEVSAGLSADGTLPAYSSTNYLDAQTSLRAATIMLDSKVKSEAIKYAIALGG
jgi:hypothetical protein